MSDLDKMIEDLDKMIEDAIDHVKQMTPEQRAAMYEAQKRSFIRGEASFGSDEDETAYSCAILNEDASEIARLESEASARVDAVDAYLDTETHAKGSDPDQ